MKQVVKINAFGLRVGEDHQRAKLTDHEVDQIRELHDQGVCCPELARMFEVRRETIWRIVNSLSRAQTVVGHRLVVLPDE